MLTVMKLMLRITLSLLHAELLKIILNKFLSIKWLNLFSLRSLSLEIWMKTKQFLNSLSTFILKVIFYTLNISLDPEKIQPYMQNITITCLKLLIDEKCDEVPEHFKFEVGKFIKNIIMVNNLALLQDLESKMSPEEKQDLAKYL